MIYRSSNTILLFFAAALLLPLTGGCHSQTNASELASKPVIEQVAFSGQLTPEDMAGLAQAGYKSVINNRPDREDGDSQATSQSIEVAAHKAGLAYAHIPIISGAMTDDNVKEVATKFNGMPKPIMMFCRSGHRAKTAYTAAIQKGLIHP